MGGMGGMGMGGMGMGGMGGGGGGGPRVPPGANVRARLYVGSVPFNITRYAM
jgi:hypothetical protein